MDKPTSIEVGFNIEHERFKRETGDKIDALRREYIDLFTARDHMLSHERDDLYCRYVQLIGRYKYECFKLSVEVRMLKMKVEMAQASINRNCRPNLAKINAEVEERLRNYLQDLELQRKAVEEAELADHISGFVIGELKDLYRVLVKRLHPDIHPDLPDDLADLFIQGQAAYRSCDIDLLRQIVKRLALSQPAGSIASESPDETISRLTRDIEAIRNDISNLRNSFPFNLEAVLIDPVSVAERVDAIKAEQAELEKQQQMYTQRLSILTSL